MNHSTSNPTKADLSRFAKLKALGCVACKLDGLTDDQTEPQIHHYLSGNKRIGHHATVPLCYFHHNGLPYDGIPTAWLLANVGPSFHKHTREFRKRYGSDKELLETVNQLIGSNA